MPRKLAVTTVVPAHGHDDVPDGYLVLGPDSEVPDWAVDLIGDHCWAADEKPATPAKPAPKSSDK